MFLRLVDPALYPRDWFLHSQGHYPVRKVFLWLELGLFKILPNLPLMLFLQFMVYLAAVAAALRAIVSRSGETSAVWFIWALLISTTNDFADLGTAHMIDSETIPRMYSYAGVLWAIPLLLAGGWRTIAAGALMGSTGLVQAAPPLQMLPIFIPWLFLIRGWRRGLQETILLTLGFFATFWPNSVILRDVVAGVHHFTKDQIILYMAHLRHPHHMLPALFSSTDYVASIPLFFILWGWVRGKTIEPRHRSLFILMMCILVFLLIAPIFIYAYPIAGWIEFQPFRLYPTFRIVFFFFLAVHLARLLRSPERLEVLRVAILLLAAYKSDDRWLPFFAILVTESLLIFLRTLVSPAAYRRWLFFLPIVAISAWAPFGGTRYAVLLVLWILLGLSPQFYARFQDGFRRLAAWPRLPVASATLGLLFLILLLAFPFRAWRVDPGTWSPLTQLHQRLTMNYQVYPYPLYALEFAGVWAHDHTPADAMFVIPPDRASESFQVWSERSAVFNVKTFPYLKSEWQEWLDRYVTVLGILDPAKHPGDVEIVLNDRGGKNADASYLALDAATLVQIMNRYNADYLITLADHQFSTRYLRQVGPTFFDLQDIKNKRLRSALRIYQSTSDTTSTLAKHKQ